MFNALSLAEKLSEIDRTDQLLARFDGIRHHRFRPPRGVFSLALTLRFAVARRNLAYWSYDSLDYQRKPPADLIDLLRKQPPRAGDILLMHDDSDCSTQMLTTLIPEWKADGYTFAALQA
jgi:peptidoglycan/xylan/chitin deacetylase (PgdA/CDA1 family)